MKETAILRHPTTNELIRQCVNLESICKTAIDLPDPIPIHVNNSKVYLTLKRMGDIFCSTIGIIVLLPLMLTTAIAIFIDDPHGSPIYSQIRVGKDSRTFRFFKFRSMIVGADDMISELKKLNEKDGPVFKIKDDPRITKVGKFIRKTSIDELPQLLNVLKGDMSIVGPRPALPREVVKYGIKEKARLMVKPGLTCLWQVQEHRDDICFDDWMKLDIQYICERGCLYDLKLVLQTFKVIFTLDGE